MGGLTSLFGGAPKPKPAAPREPVVAAPKQEAPGTTPASRQQRSVARQRSQLVSGRPGTPTRGGVNVPGR